MEHNEIDAALKYQQEDCLIKLYNTGVKWMTKHVTYAEDRPPDRADTPFPFIALHKIKEKPKHPAYWSHAWTAIESGSDLYLLLPFLKGGYAKPFDVSAAVGQILKERWTKWSEETN